MTHATTGRDILGLPATLAGGFILSFALAHIAYTVAWPQAPVMEGDSEQYLEVARDLADGSLDSLHFRTIGYPLLLLVTGSGDGPTRMLFHLSLILHFASVWALAAALHQAGARRRWVLALAGVLLLPPYVEPSAMVMTENLAQFLLAVGCAASIMWWARNRYGWLGVAAFALACSTVVRPVYQLLLPILSVGLTLSGMASAVATTRTAHFRTAAALALAWTVVVGGTAAFNSMRFGWFGLAPSAGFHLTTKTMSLVERLPDRYAPVRDILIRERDAELTRRGGTHTGTQAIWRAWPELEQVTGLEMPELSAYLIRMNLALIASAPLEYLQEVARSVAVYWFPASGRLASMGTAWLRWTWILLHGATVALFALQLAVLATLCAATISGRHVTGRSRTMPDRHVTRVQAFAFILVLTVLLYTMVMSCAIDIGEPRQRRSTDALLVFLVLLGLSLWRRTIDDLSRVAALAAKG